MSAPADSIEQVPFVQKTAPERIYLTVSDSEHDANSRFPDDHDGVCWCEDEALSVCVPYIRADIAALAGRGEAITPCPRCGGSGQGRPHEFGACSECGGDGYTTPPPAPDLFPAKFSRDGDETTDGADLLVPHVERAARDLEAAGMDVDAGLLRGLAERYGVATPPGEAREVSATVRTLIRERELARVDCATWVNRSEQAESQCAELRAAQYAGPTMLEIERHGAHVAWCADKLRETGWPIAADGLYDTAALLRSRLHRWC